MNSYKAGLYLKKNAWEVERVTSDIMEFLDNIRLAIDTNSEIITSSEWMHHLKNPYNHMKYIGKRLLIEKFHEDVDIFVDALKKKMIDNMITI